MGVALGEATRLIALSKLPMGKRMRIGCLIRCLLFLNLSIAPSAAATASPLPENPLLNVQPDDLVNVMVGGVDLASDPLGTASGFLVSIEARREKGGAEYKKCLGAAVSLDVVLTAGHCLTGMKDVTVKFISNISPLEFEVIRAKKWAVHPNYNGGRKGEMYEGFDVRNADDYHDLAVILLQKSSQIAVPITVVPEDFSPNLAPMGSKFFSFGYLRNDLFVYQDAIHFLNFGAVGFLGPAKHWFKTMMLQPEGTLSCEGDSGSPVTISAEDEYVPGRDIHYLVGLQVTVGGSASSPANLEAALKEWGQVKKIPFCGQIVTFIDIHHHLGWIREKLAELDPENARDLYVFGE